MTANLPEALASVLAEMERDHLGYVLYHDPSSPGGVVIMVGGPAEIAMLETALRRAGAETSAGTSENEFVFKPMANGERRNYVVRTKMGSGKSTIANLLWLAATDEGAAAARDSLKH